MAKVSVDGEGKAKGAADIAVIHVLVQNDAKDQQTCRQENNLASKAVIATLKAVVDENDLYVTPATVHDKHVYSKKGSLQAKGYRGNNVITAKVRKLDSAQELLTEINNLDVERIQVCRVEYDIDDKKELEDQARRAAFAHAKAKIETYAQETQLPISGLVSIEEHLRYTGGGRRHFDVSAHSSGPPERMSASLSGRVEMLEIGDIEVTVNIAACFRIGED